MKKKYVNKTYLKRALDYDITISKDETLNCFVTIKKIKKVSEKLIGIHISQKVCILDDNYTIVHLTPLDQNYAITNIFDQNNDFVECYIDITKQIGIDENEELFFDDLYLDLVVYKGEIFILDEDEMEEAYEQGLVSKQDYDFAYRELKNLIEEIKNNNNMFVDNFGCIYEKHLNNLKCNIY